MKKNQFVLSEMGNILKSLTRGLDLNVLTSGYGEENGVPISYQAQSPVLGLVLPSNSPGVHTLWLPIIPMQIGLVLKPGPQEPWTPYRVAEAFFQAGIPREAISIYPGEAEVGAAVVAACGRSLIFGGTATVERYKGNPHVQVHGPGFSKIVFGDDCVDDWEKYVDMMADSVFLNSGRGCINCSGIWVSRNSREIADALAKRLGRDSGAAAGRSERQPCGVYGARHGRGDLAVDRRRSESVGRDRLHREVPRHAARHQERPRRISAADGRALRIARGRDRVERVHVPVRHGRRVSRSEAARGDGADARVHGDHREARAAPRVPRRDAHRSAESRAGADHPSQLAPAARRQHRRFPVPPARVAERQHVKILFITAGAAGMYCGSCLRDNALAAELKSRGHDVLLVPLYTPTLTDEPNVSEGRVFFGGISVYLQQKAPFFRWAPRILDKLLDAPWLIKAASSGSISTDPRSLGELTISMLKGEDGFQRKEFEKMLEWLASEPAAGRGAAAERAAREPRASDQPRAESARCIARCRAKICFSTASRRRTAPRRST